jgi:hypothetical protein
MKDTPALVRHDLRVWLKQQTSSTVASLGDMVITGVRNLENNPENDQLRASLWSTIKDLGAAVGRPIVPAE